MKTLNLFADTHIKPGTLVAKLAITLPAPIVTSNAGKAQHINVLMELNKLKKLMTLFMLLY